MALGPARGNGSVACRKFATVCANVLFPPAGARTGLMSPPAKK